MELDIFDPRVRINGVVYRAALSAQVRIQETSVHVVSLLGQPLALSDSDGGNNSNT